MGSKKRPEISGSGRVRTWRTSKKHHPGHRRFRIMKRVISRRRRLTQWVGSGLLLVDKFRKAQDSAGCNSNRKGAGAMAIIHFHDLPIYRLTEIHWDEELLKLAHDLIPDQPGTAIS